LKEEFMSNILSRVSKRFSDTLAVVRAAGASPTEINCAADTIQQDGKGGLPYGFFLVRHTDGAVKLGYKFPPVVVIHVDENGKKHERKVASPFGHSYDVGESFKHPGTGATIKLDVPRAALKVFKLNLRGQVEGVVNLGGMLVMDTESAERALGFSDGSVGYDGTCAPRRDGMEFI
jgi:hypothetical protein